MFTNIWFDLKYSWRLLFQTPAYSVLSVVVIAASIGLATFNYVMDYNIAFKPLPFPGSGHWYSVQVADKALSSARPRVDAYTYQEILKSSHRVQHLGAFATRSAVLSEGQASASLRVASISPALLSATRAHPLLGRIFDATDGEVGATSIAILSFSTWQNFFASDPGIVGKQARIDGQSVQIVGVMPQDFLAFRDFELWLPLQLPQLARPEDSTVILSPLILLDRDSNAGLAQAEIEAAVEKVNQDYPRVFDAKRHVELFPAYRMSTHGNVPIIAISLAVAAAIVLLGCVNISVVFFARFLERSHELALRTALGSSRARLLRQCLLESVFIVLLGLLGALVLAWLGVRWGQSLGDMHQQVEASGRSLTYPVIRPMDLLIATAVTTVIWLSSTLFPAWRIANQDAAVELAGTGKGVAGMGGAKSASILVGIQVVVASLVTVICVNVVVATREEASKPMGVVAGGIMLSTYPTLFADRYSNADQRLRYWDELTAAINGRMPGSDVAYATAVPTEPAAIPAAIEHQEGASDQGTLKLPVITVSNNYFNLLGITLRAGRGFESTDNSESLGVAIVDEKTAQRYWGTQDILGKRIQLNPDEHGPWLTVVGVTSAVSRPYSDYTGVIYRPLRQAVPQEFLLLTKLPTSAADNRVKVTEAAFAVDRDLPLRNLQMLDDYLRVLNLSTTALVPPFTAVTLVTVLLAASGLFGLISRSVIRRTQEVGIRMALGGTRRQVTAVLLRPALAYLLVAVLGVCLGLLVSSVLSGPIPNILTHGISVTVVVFLIMAVVILVAAYTPTRRTVALEPGDALRYE